MNGPVAEAAIIRIWKSIKLGMNAITSDWIMLRLNALGKKKKKQFVKNIRITDIKQMLKEHTNAFSKALMLAPCGRRNCSIRRNHRS